MLARIPWKTPRAVNGPGSPEPELLAEDVRARLGDRRRGRPASCSCRTRSGSCRRTSRRDRHSAEAAHAARRRTGGSARRGRPCRRRTAAPPPRTWPSCRRRGASRPEAPPRGSRRPSSACHRRPARAAASGCRRTSRYPRARRSGRRPARRPSSRSPARDPLPLTSDWHPKASFSRANLAIMALDASGQRLPRPAAAPRRCRARRSRAAGLPTSGSAPAARTDPRRTPPARDSAAGRARARPGARRQPDDDERRVRPAPARGLPVEPTRRGLVRRLPVRARRAGLPWLGETDEGLIDLTSRRRARFPESILEAATARARAAAAPPRRRRLPRPRPPGAPRGGRRAVSQARPATRAQTR